MEHDHTPFAEQLQPIDDAERSLIRGMCWGMALSVPMWAALGLVLWVVL